MVGVNARAARCFGLGLGLCLLAASAATAQTGGISVLVTDEAGAPLAGATVTISHETGFVAATAVYTDPSGVAAFPVLRPGSGYSLEVAFPGLTTVRQDGLRVQIEQVLVVPIRLVPEFQERIKVTARSDIIDLTTTRQSTRFSEDFISDLPVPGRFYQNVLTMAPGVQDADGDGNPNVHGSRSRDFQAIVGGVSNVDPLTGQWMSRVNPNSIEEMEVITSGAGVEFGRAQGGFARIIQKQGSNTHEGVAEFYYRSSNIDGNGAVDESALEDADFDWYQPAAQLSGPIVRDRMWYRASVEYRDVELPVVTGGFEVTTVEDKTNDFQVTWQASPRNKLALNYRYDPRLVRNFGVSSLVDSRSSLGFERETHTTSLTWTAPYSPKVLVESMLSWQDQNLTVFPTTAGVSNDCVVGVGFLADARCFNSDTGKVSGSYNLDQSDHRQRLSVKGSATFYGGRFWGMSHRFKLGLQTEGERYFRDLTLGTQIAYFVQRTPGNELDPIGIIIADVAVPPSDDVRATGQNWALYGEDQFKPLSNLTLTAGLRIDREEIHSEGREPLAPADELARYIEAVEPFVDPLSPLFNPGATQVSEAASRIFTGYERFFGFEQQISELLCEPGDGHCFADVRLQLLSEQQRQIERTRRAADLVLENTNFSPYLSAAWDPFRDGKMAVKASAGRHYNNIPLIIPLQELQPAHTTLLYEVELGGENAGNTTLRSGITPGINVTVVDPDLRTPYQDEYVLGIERELWAETSLSLTWVNRRYRDQLQDTNLNVDTGDYGACAFQSQPTEPALVESWGAGFQLHDPFSGRVYVDEEPGPGDGIPDDCVGRWEPYGQDPQVLQRPDGLLDLYKQNPYWGDIYVIGNYNAIDYEAVVLELIRRQYRSWELQGSYTWSEALGDGEDYAQDFDNDPSVLPLDRRGYQAYDQRHVVKVNATTITPWGLRLGTSVSWQSGLPFSVLYRQPAVDTLPPVTRYFGIVGSRSRLTYPSGVRNDQRNSAYWNVDLKLTKELKLASKVNVQLTAEVYNVLDDGTYQVYNADLERGVQVNGINEYRRRFGREWQLGFKVSF